MWNDKQRVSKKIIILIFLLLLWTIDTVQAESQTAYQVQIALKDGSEYIGWVPDGFII